MHFINRRTVLSAVPPFLQGGNNKVNMLWHSMIKDARIWDSKKSLADQKMSWSQVQVNLQQAFIPSKNHRKKNRESISTNWISWKTLSDKLLKQFWSLWVLFFLKVNIKRSWDHGKVLPWHQCHKTCAWSTCEFMLKLKDCSSLKWLSVRQRNTFWMTDSAFLKG